MSKRKSIADTFREIGLERPRDQNTIKTQILDYLDQTCGSREQVVNLKLKGLSNLLDRFLDTGPGRYHFPRDRDNGQWIHYCSRDEVMNKLAEIVTKWLPGLKKKDKGVKPRSTKGLKQGSNVCKTSKHPRRMTIPELEANQGIELDCELRKEFPDLGEIFTEPPTPVSRDTREETVMPDPIVPDAEPQTQTAHGPASKSAILPSSHFRAVDSSSTNAMVPESSGTKRRYQETTIASQEHEDETEDETDEEDLKGPVHQVGLSNKKPRLDRPASCPRPMVNDGGEILVGRPATPPQLPSLASPRPAEETQQPNIVSYRIDIPADLFTRVNLQDRASFWPDLMTDMIRDRQQARTGLDAERNELHNEDVRGISAIDRVLQDLHDDFEAIRMIWSGRRRDFEDMVRRRE